MPSAADIGMIDLDDLNNPITFRFNVGTHFGRSFQEVTVDTPGAPTTLEGLTLFAALLWSSSIANAINASAELLFTECVVWKAGPAALLLTTTGIAGNVHGSRGPDAEAGVMVMHTGDSDKYSRRPMYFSDFSASWRDDRVLTPVGLTGMYTTCAAMAMGLGVDLFGGPMSWLLHYARVIPFRPNNILGVAFRRVRYVRVLSYCDRPPDDVSLDWP